MLADWTIHQSVAPSALPLTPDELKRNLNLPALMDHHDAKLAEYIQGATAKFEADTGRVCLSQTFVQTLNYLPRTEPIDLGKRPVSAINSIQYLDPDGNVQFVLEEVYSLSNNRRRIYVNYGHQWPDHRVWTESVKVSFAAGVESAELVPGLYKTGISLAVGGWFVDPTDQNQRQQWRTAYGNIVKQLLGEKEY